MCTGTVTSDDRANVIAAADHVVGAHETFIEVEQLQKGLCGKSRPHFFRGVATVGLWYIAMANLPVTSDLPLRPCCWSRQ